MEWLVGVAVMAGMMALRFAVPVAITLALVYVVRRLDARMHPAVIA